MQKKSWRVSGVNVVLVLVVVVLGVVGTTFRFYALLKWFFQRCVQELPNIFSSGKNPSEVRSRIARFLYLSEMHWKEVCSWWEFWTHLNAPLAQFMVGNLNTPERTYLNTPPKNALQGVLPWKLWGGSGEVTCNNQYENPKRKSPQVNERVLFLLFKTGQVWVPPPLLAQHTRQKSGCLSKITACCVVICSPCPYDCTTPLALQIFIVLINAIVFCVRVSLFRMGIEVDSADDAVLAHLHHGEAIPALAQPLAPGDPRFSLRVVLQDGVLG